MAQTYATPSLKGYGSMTKLTAWNNENMVCSGQTFFSGTWGNRPINPDTGNPFTHTSWYAYADAHSCVIYNKYGTQIFP
jgi:hypothetical protein